MKEEEKSRRDMVIVTWQGLFRKRGFDKNRRKSIPF